MGKIKAATISERFGFKDEDLKTTKHDEIMVWLDANMESAAEALLSQGVFAYAPLWLRHGNEKGLAVEWLLGTCREKGEPVCKIHSCEWEFAITNRDYVIGFVDMIAEVDVFEVGRGPTLSVKVAFEIKTTIPSLGELLRQIAHYRTYLKHHLFVVVSPDNRWEEMLKKNDILFLHYPQETTRVSLFDV